MKAKSLCRWQTPSLDSHVCFEYDPGYISLSLNQGLFCATKRSCGDIAIDYQHEKLPMKPLGVTRQTSVLVAFILLEPDERVTGKDWGRGIDYDMSPEKIEGNTTDERYVDMLHPEASNIRGTLRLFWHRVCGLALVLKQR